MRASRSWPYVLIAHGTRRRRPRKSLRRRLMRRLLGYLRPYLGQASLALVGDHRRIGPAARAALSDAARDRPTTSRIAIAGLARIAWLYLACSWPASPRIPADLDDAADGAADHVRPADGDLPPPAAARPEVLRPQSRRPADDARHDDVDVLNDLFTAGVVAIFGDVFTLAGIMIVMLGMNWRLALARFSVLPLIVVVTQWFRRNVRESYRVVRALDCAHQCVPAGEHHGDVDGADLPPRGPELRAVRRDQPRAPRRQHRVDLLLRGVLSGDRVVRRPGGRADHLVRRRWT